MTALNELGKPVDWWFIYKTPDRVGRKDNKGYDYFYFDDMSKEVSLSKNELNLKGGALHYTLDAVFNSGDSNQGYIVYNDEQTDGTSNDGGKGHTKGVLVFNKQENTGLILLHSTPRFPAKGEDILPKKEAIYGQTYLCITLKDFTTLENIAAQMLCQQNPQILEEDCYMPKGFDPSSPLSKLVGQKDIDESKTPSTVDFESKKGKQFKLIAKSKKWGKDFWIDLISPELGVDLNSETWRRGKVTESTDKGVSEEVEDVMQVDFGPLGFKGYAWKYTKDHSKWGAATTKAGSKSPWVCIADINRMKSQEKRGGGGICFQEPNLWKVLNSIEATVQED